MQQNLKITLACLGLLIGILVFFGKNFSSISSEKQAPPKETGKKISGHSQEHSYNEKETIDHSDPKNQHRMGIFHYNAGNRFLKKDDWAEAIHNYKMALHHDKTLHEVYVNLSTAYLKGRQFSDAFITLQDLEKQQPQYSMLHYNLACYHSLTGDIASALDSLQQAVKLGFKNKQQIQTDPDLENLRNEPHFQEWFQIILRK